VAISAAAGGGCACLVLAGSPTSKQVHGDELGRGGVAGRVSEAHARQRDSEHLRGERHSIDQIAVAAA
jgi:hypothetical protein